MSTADRDEQMAFMEAQGLSIEMQQLFADRKIGVIAHAIALTLGTFAATSGEDPTYVIETVAAGALAYAHDKPEPRVKN